MCYRSEWNGNEQVYNNQGNQCLKLTTNDVRVTCISNEITINAATSVTYRVPASLDVYNALAANGFRYRSQKILVIVVNGTGHNYCLGTWRVDVRSNI